MIINVVKFAMECVACKTAWTDPPGQFGRNFVQGCPKCNSLYWTAKPTDEKISLKLA